MSVLTRRPATDRVIVRNVSWETYERLLKDLENSSSPRLAYDQGVLEIMSPHLEHEEANGNLETLVQMALEEMDLDFRNAGSTTFKRADVERGFEPDSSFYIQSIERVRNRKGIDFSVDPPPDLIIEVDLTRDSLSKFSLYAALRVPEVWRYEDALEIWMLNQSRYTRRHASVAIPIFTDQVVTDLLQSSVGMKRPAWFRHIRKEIHTLIKA